eukprot:GHVU01021083.1.p1 GENE.GHVU01021083.1~~GHVU01021083.1.p1  ORF type:complete len:133 (+),score=1.09 GHVU01021083.1:324-722(+)
MYMAMYDFLRIHPREQYTSEALPPQLCCSRTVAAFSGARVPLGTTDGWQAGSSSLTLLLPIRCKRAQIHVRDYVRTAIAASAVNTSEGACSFSLLIIPLSSSQFLSLSLMCVTEGEREREQHGILMRANTRS